MEDFTVEKCFILLSFLLNFILVIEYYFKYDRYIFHLFIFFKEYFILYLDKFLILDDIFEMKNFSNFCNIFDDI